jgi:hypothetical protein
VSLVPSRAEDDAYLEEYLQEQELCFDEEMKKEAAIARSLVTSLTITKRQRGLRRIFSRTVLILRIKY